MANYERIKAMSVEEMAEDMGFCGFIEDCKHGNCTKCIRAWLESEVQDEAD